MRHLVIQEINYSAYTDYTSLKKENKLKYRIQH